MLRAFCRILLTIFSGLAIGLAPARANTGSDELVLGIFPFLSANQTVELFAPLSDHLARALGRPVSLRSAPDFERFVERTRAGEYDIVFTAPHLGRFAEKRDGYLPIAQTGYSIVVVVLARNDSSIKTLADLKGHSFAVGAKLSLAYLSVDHALKMQGLSLGRDVTFVGTTNFSNVLDALIRNEADAGATGSFLWDKAPADKHNFLHEIWRAPAVPGFLFLAHPRIDAATIRRLEPAILGFNATPAGKRYFEKTQQIDFRPVDVTALKRIDPYTAVFDRR